MISEIDRWLYEKSLSYFGITVLEKGDYDFGIDTTSSLYPLTNIYRARMLLWVTLEYGGYWNDAKVRRERFDFIRGLLEKAKQAFPESRLTPMYLGEPIPPQKHYPPAPGAPEWAVYQREAIERLEKLFTAWMDTWVDAAARAERGKPTGIIPSAIHWQDGVIGGLGEKWWKPENHHPHSSLYVWPSAMSMMLNTLLLTHHITQNSKYLQPIRSMAKIRLDYLQNPPKEPPAPGSKAWCGSKLGSISSVIAKYMLLGGTAEFNQLIETDANPYVTFRFRGERQPLVTALRNNAEALRVNFKGYTSEVRYTDRVLRFLSIFSENGMYPLPVQTIRQPNTNLLYSTLTGDPGDAGYFPINAVRWLTPPRDIAALVTETGRDRFEAELYHFGDEPWQMSAELYLLDVGNYTLSLYPKHTNAHEEKTFKMVTVLDATTHITFQLPARALCILEICRAGERD